MMSKTRSEPKKKEKEITEVSIEPTITLLCISLIDSLIVRAQDQVHLATIQ